MTVETYASEKTLTKTQEITYKPPEDEVNPYPRGTPQYYQTQLKLKTKTLIRARLFLDQNLDPPGESDGKK